MKLFCHDLKSSPFVGTLLCTFTLIQGIISYIVLIISMKAFRWAAIWIVTTVLSSSPIANAQPPRSLFVAQSVPAASKPDLTLLTTAAANFFKGEVLQTESSTEIVGTGQGTNIKVRFQSKTIVQSPNRFRSEITLLSSGKARSTIVVSDGQRVSIYRSDLNQSLTMSYSQFDRRDDSYGIGMSSVLYLIMAPELKPLAAQGALTDKTVQTQLRAMTPANLSGEARSINHQNLYVYNYGDRQKNFSYEAAIDPSTATLKQLQIKGSTEGMNITITETINRRSSLSTINADSFRFTPPRTAKAVKTLEIVPF